MRGHRVGQFRDCLHTLAETDLRFEPVFHRRQAQPFEPGHRRAERFAVLHRDILHGRTAPQGEGFAQQPNPPGALVLASLSKEAFEPQRVDSVGCHRQPVAARLPLHRPFRQHLPQPGSQALQGIRRVGGRALTPNPVDERRLRDYVTCFEREGDQQPAQPGARHLGEDAVVRANLEWSKQPDLHYPILPWAIGRPPTADTVRGAVLPSKPPRRREAEQAAAAP
jgi:hypothetical protein